VRRRLRDDDCPDDHGDDPNDLDRFDDFDDLDNTIHVDDDHRPHHDDLHVGVR
jgi:hypothetical protein